MLGYLIRRILAAIPVMGVVALFVFLLLRLTPGDPAAILAGDNATPEQLDRIRTSLGLNEPLYTQFVTCIGKLLHGDLGVSLISGTPVMKMIAGRLEPTTIRSGLRKSCTALPSRRNSGFQTRVAPVPAIVSASRAAVPTGTVDLPATTSPGARCGISDAIAAST